MWLILLALPSMTKAQTISEFEIKAVFIYNFTQFVQWPEKSFERTDSPFVIGVLGDNVFGKYLEEAVAGERHQSRPIVVKYFASPGDVEFCQILYVGPSGNIMSTNDRPVLTVGEHENFMRQKGHLRFYWEGKKLRIEINQSAAAASGLTISSKLLHLARIYEEK